MLAKCTEGISDNANISSVSVESECNRIESLENELKIAKEMIQGLKMERRKLRADKNGKIFIFLPKKKVYFYSIFFVCHRDIIFFFYLLDLLQQVKHLCTSLQEKEQELRNFIRKFDQKLRENDNSSARASNSDIDHDKLTLMKHAQEEAERSNVLAAQLNVKELQIKRMEQQLIETRRHLSKYSPDQDGISINHSQVGVMNHGCEENDSSRGGHDPSRINDREAMTEFMLNEGDNDCIVIDSDSISLISNHMNMGSCKY
jgi:hypothetical protein